MNASPEMRRARRAAGHFGNATTDPSNDSTPRALGESLRDAARAVGAARRELVAHGVTARLVAHLARAESALGIAGWVVTYCIAERGAA